LHWHAELPAGELEFGGHAVQIEAPAAEYVPAAQHSFFSVSNVIDSNSARTLSVSCIVLGS